MMDLSKKRCGECGEKAYTKKDLIGKWQKQWKNYPSVFLMRPLSLWVCSNCNSYALTPGDAAIIDNIVEESIRAQTSQYLEIIKSKSGLTFEEIAKRIGKGPSYLSSLYQRKKTPAFGLWNQLKSIALDPVEEMDRLDPDLDIFERNVLLRSQA